MTPRDLVNLLNTADVRGAFSYVEFDGMHYNVRMITPDDVRQAFNGLTFLKKLCEVLALNPDAQLVVRIGAPDRSLILTLREFQQNDRPPKVVSNTVSRLAIDQGGEVFHVSLLERLEKQLAGQRLDDNPKAVAKREKTAEIMARRREK